MKHNYRKGGKGLKRKGTKLETERERERQRQRQREREREKRSVFTTAQTESANPHFYVNH